MKYTRIEKIEDASTVKVRQHTIITKWVPNRKGYCGRKYKKEIQKRRKNMKMRKKINKYFVNNGGKKVCIYGTLISVQL